MSTHLAAGSRSDEIPDPNTISERMVASTIQSDLIVVDLSGLNPNVMYELGIADAFERRVITLGHPEDKVPFDVKDRTMVPIPSDEDGRLFAADIGGLVELIRKMAETALAADYSPRSVVTAAGNRAELGVRAERADDAGAMARVELELRDLRNQIYQLTNPRRDERPLWAAAEPSRRYSLAKGTHLRPFGEVRTPLESAPSTMIS